VTAGALLAAWDEVRSHPQRTALTMASVLVGVAAVVVVVALGDIASRSVEVEVERSLGRAATVEVRFSGEAGTTVAERAERRAAVAHTVSRLAGATASPVEEAELWLPGRGGTAPVAALAVDPSFADVRRLDVVIGRWLADADADGYAPAVVLNRAAFEHAGAPGAAAPLRLGLLEPVVVRVVGVVDDRRDGPTAYLPVAAVDRWGYPPGVDPVVSHLVHVPPDRLRSLVALVRADTRQRDPDVVVDVARVDDAGDLTAAIDRLRLTLALVAGVALVSGGIGIVNVNLVTVGHRTREMAIRRSFGARRRDVFVQVLAEQVVTAAVAGVIGVAVALPAVWWLPGQVIGAPVVAVLPVRAAVVGLAVATAVGVAAGLLPARRATASTVVDGLRGGG
jgi:putative ABC transport system permease protein